jgi:hypothetical protein
VEYKEKWEESLIDFALKLTKLKAPLGFKNNKERELLTLSSSYNLIVPYIVPGAYLEGLSNLGGHTT